MFRTVILLLILGLSGVSVRVEAQPSTLAAARKKAVYGTDYYVSPSTFDYTAAAQAIVGDASTAYDRAQRLYLWLCSNVTYDLSGTVRTADACWRRRTAVCQGYCELFYRMAETIGVKSKLVFGRCKHAGADTALEDHTWLSVETEKGPILLDPTWGSGGYAGGAFVRLANPLLWFDVAPAWFIFTHLPNNHRRQLLSAAVSDAQFGALPYVTPQTAQLGLSGQDVLARMLSGGDAPPVVVSQHADLLEGLTIVEMPTTRHLAVDSTYTFVVGTPTPDLQLTIVGDGERVGQARWTVVEGPPSVKGAAPSAAPPPHSAPACDARVKAPTFYSVAVTPRRRGRLTLALTPRAGVPALLHLVEYEVE